MKAASPQLTEKQRLDLLNRVARLVREKLYDPNLNGVDWDAAVNEARTGIAAAADPIEFELRINELLKKIGLSHLGFFHESGRSASGKAAIGVTFAEDKSLDPPRWVFEDVHEYSPAACAGIQPGWTLIAVNGEEFSPPKHALFRFDSSNSVEALDREMRQRSVVIEVPRSKKKSKPFAEFPPVSSRQSDGRTLVLKVSHFPGVVGIDVANEISKIVAESKPQRLVVDLRGNTGGGLGCLRLMSLLVPDRQPIGYGMTRKAIERGVRPESLPRFNRIPANRIEVLPLFLQFGFRDKSVLLETEGLGPQPFHGSVSLLVNKHTASASEMVAAFAAESNSAIVVGTKTAGRVTGGKSFRLPLGYYCAVPVSSYRTRRGASIENAGVVPAVGCRSDLNALRTGYDWVEQALSAIEAVHSKQ